MSLARLARAISSITYSGFNLRRRRRRRCCRMRPSYIPLGVRSSVTRTRLILQQRLGISAPTWLRRLMPPPRYHRLILAAVFVNFFVLLAVYLNWPRPHHAPFTAPDSKPVIHGTFVNKLPESLYPLDPFPDSPLQSFGNSTDEQPWPRPWLAAVICAASDAQSRMRIRSTWMKLYKNLPFDARFVVANPGPHWTEMVAMENRTFGDMIVLDKIQEDDFTANTLKTLEFYRHLVDNNLRYEYVTKLDTDSWLNARGFWDRFLVPRMSNETGQLKATVSRTVISELYFSGPRDLVFPNGSMYTITWDLVEILVALQYRFSIVMGEDMTFSILLLKGKQVINFVNFRGSEKFDYDDLDSRGDGTAWARTGSHLTSVAHAIGSRDAILIHHLKTETVWFKVAACFDENGVKEIPQKLQAEQWPPLLMLWFDFWYWAGVHAIWRERIEDVPDFLWTQNKDGDWICDGIFNLGPTKTGYIEA
ncbi:hypothetical protein HJFPF1_03555 [Paramyrothecium foliicola]|nr:hypothetical protein HJFPF1_03555 [Paramyrothecium foliicola]